ncbi:MAG TPA: zf-TFIIB domain-containing protein [Candidatus Angelobacter sp.]|nr:zf-TFIIB domain-containing protein [Candidatus Angelobacter sp.]
MFVGAKFCSHCGARAARTEVADARQLCPRCQVEMKAVTIGSSSLQECMKCEGLWADVATLQQICAEREKQASVLGLPAPALEKPGIEKNIRYIPCPMCHQLMNRVNFAHCSNVIVDVCKAHGTWFDKDELRRTVEFIRSGGLEKARERQLSAMEEERKRLLSAQHAGIPLDLEAASAAENHDVGSGVPRAIDLLISLLR